MKKTVLTLTLGTIGLIHLTSCTPQNPQPNPPTPQNPVDTTPVQQLNTYRYEVQGGYTNWDGSLISVNDVVLFIQYGDGTYADFTEDLSYQGTMIRQTSWSGNRQMSINAWSTTYNEGGAWVKLKLYRNDTLVASNEDFGYNAIASINGTY